MGLAAASFLAAPVAISRRDSPKVQPKGVPLRRIATPKRSGCSNPRGLVTTDPATGATSTLVAPCDRLTCPECRDYNTEEWAERVLTGFEGQLMYRQEVPAAEWVAWKARATRRGVRRVAVPAFDGSRVVFTTAPVDPDAEMVLDEGRAVREALGMRPFRDRRRVRATPGFLPEAASAAKDTAEEAPDPDRLEVVGFWNPREGIRQAQAAAEAVGLRVRRYSPTPRVLAGFALEGIDWRRDRHRPEIVRFLRAIAFQPIADDTPAVPLDEPVRLGHPLGGFEPPWDSYEEPPLDFEEVA